MASPPTPVIQVLGGDSWWHTLLDGAFATVVIGAISVLVAWKVAAWQRESDSTRDVQQRSAERGLALELTSLQAAQSLAGRISLCIQSASQHHQELSRGEWRPITPSAQDMINIFVEYVNCVRTQASSLQDEHLRRSIWRSLSILDTFGRRYHELRLGYKESFVEETDGIYTTISRGPATMDRRQEFLGLFVHAHSYLMQLLRAVAKYQEGETLAAVIVGQGMLETGEGGDELQAGGQWATLNPT